MALGDLIEKSSLAQSQSPERAQLPTVLNRTLLHVPGTVRVRVITVKRAFESVPGRILLR